jgi:transcriptional regulator with XRE-family HTH domain
MTPPKRLTGPGAAAVRTFRERRGWTLEQMADAVWASPLEVAAWEAGTVRVPAEQARRMRAIDEDDRRREAAGRARAAQRLPGCRWADANAPGLHEILFHEPREVESNLLVQQHLESCAECRHVLEQGRAEPVRPRFWKLGSSAESLAPGLDGWLPLLHPFLFFAVLPVLAIGGMLAIDTMGDLLGKLPGVAGRLDPADLWVETVVFFWSVALAGRFTGKLLGRRPYTVALLAGVAGGMAALTTWNLRAPDADVTDPLVLAVCAVLALLAGLVGGWVRSGADLSYDAEWWRADAAPPAPPVRLADPALAPSHSQESPLASRDRRAASASPRAPSDPAE